MTSKIYVVKQIEARCIPIILRSFHDEQSAIDYVNEKAQEYKNGEYTFDVPPTDNYDGWIQERNQNGDYQYLTNHDYEKWGWKVEEVQLEE